MGEDLNQNQDPVWDTAWFWVIRQHERITLDEAARAELDDWLAAAAAHRLAYDKANRLWALAGLIPPVNDIEIPGCTQPDGEA